MEHQDAVLGLQAVFLHRLPGARLLASAILTLHDCQSAAAFSACLYRVLFPAHISVCVVLFFFFFLSLLSLGTPLGVTASNRFRFLYDLFISHT